MGYTIDPRSFFLSGECDECGETFIGGVADVQKNGWLFNVKRQILLCPKCREKMEKDGTKWEM